MMATSGMTRSPNDYQNNIDMDDSNDEGQMLGSKLPGGDPALHTGVVTMLSTEMREVEVNIDVEELGPSQEYVLFPGQPTDAYHSVLEWNKDQGLYSGKDGILSDETIR